MVNQIVAGFDGCSKGWIRCLWRGPGHAPLAVFLTLLVNAASELPKDTAAIGIDIPLGLLDVARRGGRESAPGHLYASTRRHPFQPRLQNKVSTMISAGKPPKVAIVAIMRKLIILANALLKAHRNWQPEAA